MPDDTMPLRHAARFFSLRYAAPLRAILLLLDIDVAIVFSRVILLVAAFHAADFRRLLLLMLFYAADAYNVAHAIFHYAAAMLPILLRVLRYVLMPLLPPSPLRLRL